ncbi:MAG: Oar-like outer membrane protein protein, OmpA family [uncultured Thermomicrobiales bacterium]|uniref:Oar-like outer membrane protein protein, OmpA family n=1 Tax=uncultured Thermomicrobiales bacterium TaxID=1645740 RepID=A0A6J4VXD8_9BACT|nr:MAG: Oar-like outer membrane protein protein, OmpA family [uncultured Thermomicrobiales bacterium]
MDRAGVGVGGPANVGRGRCCLEQEGGRGLNRYIAGLVGGGLASALVASPAWAQQTGIQINVVRADVGTPVPDAEVVIENRDRSIRRTARTDVRGQVRVEGLTTGGTYTVGFAGSQEFAAVRSEPIALRSNFTRSVTLRLTAEGAEEIVVTGSRAVTGINTVNAEISGSLSERELRDLPVEGRDVLGALVRLPNVVPSTGFFPEAPAISINGSNALDTNYLIDGLDNNENFLGGPKFPVPLGFTREVTVIANSYSVQYGRTPNGLVNFTTPSGSNLRLRQS